MNTSPRTKETPKSPFAKLRAWVGLYLLSLLGFGGFMWLCHWVSHGLVALHKAF